MQPSCVLLFFPNSPTSLHRIIFFRRCVHPKLFKYLHRGGSADSPPKRRKLQARKMPENAARTPSRLHAVLGAFRIISRLRLPSLLRKFAFLQAPYGLLTDQYCCVRVRDLGLDKHLTYVLMILELFLP